MAAVSTASEHAMCSYAANIEPLFCLAFDKRTQKLLIESRFPLALEAQ